MLDLLQQETIPDKHEKTIIRASNVVVVFQCKIAQFEI